MLQFLLYAEARRALLMVLQGIDAAGKDGTIRHVMTGLNPQGVRVTAFKVPKAPKSGMTTSGASTMRFRSWDRLESSTGLTTRLC